MGAANVVNAGYAPVLRTAGWHQTDTGLLYIPPSMRIPSPPSNLGAVSEVKFREGLVIRRFELQNLNAGAANCGIGGRIANAHWEGGRYDGTTYTKVPAYQTPVSAALQVAGADQTGFVILADQPFDGVAVNVTTAETNAGGATVVDHTVTYSKAAGTFSAALPAGLVLTDDFTTTDAVWGIAAKNLVWAKQPDWAPTDTHTGLPVGKYAMYFTSAQREAGDVAAAATGIEIFNLFLLKGLAASGIWETEEIDYWIPSADGIVAYFSVITIANRVYAEVLTR